MAFTTLLPSSSRRDIIIIATIICLLTIIISFRSVFTDHVPGQSPIGELPKFGNTPKPSSPPALVEDKQTSQSLTVELSTSSATSTTSIPASTSIIPVASETIAAGCDGFPDTSDILLVMKTGATEAYDKLPIHFLTTLKCANDSILFSDMEMDMAGHHLIDSLDEVAEEIKTNNDDFNLYRTLQTYHDLREDPRPLKSGPNGWNLDKYKFLHMLLKTYRYRPDAPWYVFIEADTALIWDNLRTFLDKLDPKTPYYIGSPTYLDIEFAHGGTGYIISREAMEVAVGKHPDIATKYDKSVHGICCGDAMIGRVLLDEKIKLSRAWPMMNGEKPSTLPFGTNQWCQPVMTMHHLTAQEVSQVWNFEQERKTQGITVSLSNTNMPPHKTLLTHTCSPQRPLLFVDIFNHFVKPTLQPLRSDWNNLSNDITYSLPPSDKPDKTYAGQKWTDLSDIQRSSLDSPENCMKACDADKDCFQWMHTDGECRIGRSIKMGGSKGVEQGRKFVSGWKFEKIERFEREMGNCSKVDWTM